uniref:Serpin domain-containing protein n=1 Tax=Romanomermis culicivorax TaxID=13658 RepID=A0A915IWN9_ROMCU
MMKNIEAMGSKKRGISSCMKKMEVEKIKEKRRAQKNKKKDEPKTIKRTKKERKEEQKNKELKKEKKKEESISEPVGTIENKKKQFEINAYEKFSMCQNILQVDFYDSKKSWFENNHQYPLHRHPQECPNNPSHKRKNHIFQISEEKFTNSPIMSSSVQLSNCQFAIRLGKVLASKYEESNLFFSPASISLVMTMCQLGTRGETEQQIKETLFGKESTIQEIMQWVESVLALKICDEEKCGTLKFANRLYMTDKCSMTDEFMGQVTGIFKTQAINVDFEKNASQVANEINQWVEEPLMFNILGKNFNQTCVSFQELKQNQ